MTDTTLAERLARCVKPLDLKEYAEDTPEWGPKMFAKIQADHVKDILAALDMDALAREVEAMVGAEREACAALLNEAAGHLRDDASKADDAGHDTSADMDRECARVLDGMAVSIRHRGALPPSAPAKEGSRE
jgi:hypothetical protein